MRKRRSKLEAEEERLAAKEKAAKEKELEEEKTKAKAEKERKAAEEKAAREKELEDAKIKAEAEKERKAAEEKAAKEKELEEKKIKAKAEKDRKAAVKAQEDLLEKRQLWEKLAEERNQQAREEFLKAKNYLEGLQNEAVAARAKAEDAMKHVEKMEKEAASASSNMKKLQDEQEFQDMCQSMEPIARRLQFEKLEMAKGANVFTGQTLDDQLEYNPALLQAVGYLETLEKDEEKRKEKERKLQKASKQAQVDDEVQVHSEGEGGEKPNVQTRGTFKDTKPLIPTLPEFREPKTLLEHDALKVLEGQRKLRAELKKEAQARGAAAAAEPKKKGRPPSKTADGSKKAKEKKEKPKEPKDTQKPDDADSMAEEIDAADRQMKGRKRE